MKLPGKRLKRTVKLTVLATAMMSTANTLNPSLQLTPISASYASTTAEQAKRTALSDYFTTSEATRGHGTPPTPFFSLFSARVNGLDSCDGDIGLSMRNAFKNGKLRRLYENFDDVLRAMMSEGGAIFLSGLYLQKSNPGLYSLFTNGINLGFDDFFKALGSCEAMLTSAYSFAAKNIDDLGNPLKALETTVKNAEHNGFNFQEIDIVEFFGSAANSSGGDTVDKLLTKGIRYWNAAGDLINNAGGSDADTSEQLSLVKTSAMKGYCILRGIEASDCKTNTNTEPSNAELVPIKNDPMFELIFGTDSDKWTNNVASLSNEIYGTVEWANGKTTEKPGIGLYNYFVNTRATISYDLERIMEYSNPVRSVSSAELKKVSAPRGINVDLIHIKGLTYLSNDYEMQQMFINGLAMDVAYRRAIWVNEFYTSAFRAIKGHEVVVDANLSEITESMAVDSMSELRDFTDSLRSQRYTPGQHIELLRKLVQFDGNTDALIDYIENRGIRTGW